MDVMPLWMEWGIIGFSGLIFGSFVTLASYRLPRDEPVIIGRSRCPSCGRHLGLAALFPVFSWLLQRGKCRYCKTSISARYPLIELTQAALFLAVYATHGIGLSSVWLLLLSVCLLIMVVVDFEWQIIPDEIQISLLVIGILYHLSSDAAWLDIGISTAIGAAIGLGLRFGYRWLRRKEGLGWGDVKFLPIAGLWLADSWHWPPFLFFAGAWGIVTAIIWRMTGQGERFPFGPALAASLLMTLLIPSTPWFYSLLAQQYD